MFELTEPPDKSIGESSRNAIGEQEVQIFPS
jgi:hypothetical protein